MTSRPQVDQAWAAQVAEFCAEAYAEYAAADPATLGQVDHVFAADYALDCAAVTHALGAGPNDVRTWIKRAAFVLGEVFRLGGTTPAFPATIVDEDGPRSFAPPGARDASLTNSRRGLLAMQVALIAGDHHLVERIAATVGDPPNATYIGPDSEVCTPEEQGLAYALKAYLLGRQAVAFFYTAGLTAAPPTVRQQALAIEALMGHEAGAFLAALDGLLSAHAATAGNPLNAREPRCLINLPALALAVLAIQSGVIDPDQVPTDDPYLPRTLLLPPSTGH
ncbi:MAG: Imm49 family immunity protein [Pseudomonadota bacterium]|nr:Imm49 family immunity protein [Pseudomonadota bacterium]